jgi:hypothetical protein
LQGIWSREQCLCSAVPAARLILTINDLLDMSQSSAFDRYLVLTGPDPIRGPHLPQHPPVPYRPCLPVRCPALVTEQLALGIKIGAASVLVSQWNAAEIYPVTSNPLLPVTERDAGATATLRIALTGQLGSAKRQIRTNKAQAAGLSTQPLLNHDQPQTAGSGRTSPDSDKINP